MINFKKSLTNPFLTFNFGDCVLKNGIFTFKKNDDISFDGDISEKIVGVTNKTGLLYSENDNRITVIYPFFEFKNDFFYYHNDMVIKHSFLASKTDVLLKGCEGVSMSLTKKYDTNNVVFIKDKDFMIVDNIQNRSNKTIGFKIKNNFIAKCKKAFKTQKIAAPRYSVCLDFLGVDIDTFIKYLESLFEVGMGWDNYGLGQNSWQFVNIQPYKKFDLNLMEDVLVCFNHKNYKPMWKNVDRVETKNNILKEVKKVGTINKVKNHVRVRFTQIFKKQNLARFGKKGFDFLGCDINFLMSHLESKFVENMNWGNYGEWHIDHIKPCCSFDLSNIEQVKSCFHYTNLQPLWKMENCIKSGSTI